MMTGTPSHLGGHNFICHEDEGALTAMHERFGCESLLDIGCGLGCQLTAALRVGFGDASGIEGDRAAIAKAVEHGVPPRLIMEHDFTTGSCKVREYDLLWSVEFLEHLEEKYLPNFWRTLTSCRPEIAILTAAPPGHGGIHHVNCQTPDYWRGAFAACSYKFAPDLTESVRKASTMKRDFVRKRGMVFTPFQ